MFFSKNYVLFVSAVIVFADAAGAFTGSGTWFNTGLGNCGKVNKNTDFIVALSTQEYNNGAHCFKHIKVHYQGKTVNAQVVDSCPSCGRYSVDLSPAAFKALAPLDVGLIHVTWNYV